MRRRDAVAALLAIGAVAGPLGAHAQGAERVYRVASILSSATAVEVAHRESSPFRAYVQAFRERGYVEGRNLILDRRTAEGVFKWMCWSPSVQKRRCQPTALRRRFPLLYRRGANFI